MAVRTQIFPILLFALLLSAANATSTLAAIEFTSWRLTNGLSDSSGPHAIQDVHDYNTITNPWVLSSVSQVGLNVSQTDYDYSWLTNGSFGTFNTAFAMTFRSRGIREVSTARMYFQTTEDVVVHFQSVLTYSHTPGAENFISWGVGLGNAGGYVVEQFHGGNGYVLPFSGTFAIDETFILPGGIDSVFNYVLDADNLADGHPGSTMDVSGYANWSFTPVPEPSSLLMLASLLPFALLRRRC